MAPLFCLHGEQLHRCFTPSTHLEYLHILDSLLRAPFLVYLAPFFDYLDNVWEHQPGERQVVSPVESKHIASALHGVSREQRVRGWRGLRSWWWKNCSIIVLKHKDLLIVWVLCASRTLVPWTEVTLGIVLGQIRRLRGLSLALPGSFHAMWGHQCVLICERVHCEIEMSLRGTAKAALSATHVCDGDARLDQRLSLPSLRCLCAEVVVVWNKGDAGIVAMLVVCSRVGLIQAVRRCESSLQLST